MQEKVRIEQNDKMIPSRRKNHQLTFNMRRSISQKSDTKIVMTVVRKSWSQSSTILIVNGALLLWHQLSSTEMDLNKLN